MDESSGDGNDPIIVQDGHTDVAKQISLEKMLTEATGRQLFQHTYLWTEKKGKGTIPAYDPIVDGPDAADKGPHLPGPHELIPTDNTKEYLEVGLIIGNNHKETGKAWNNKGAEMRRAKSAMRVFILVTDNVSTYARFYVGCRLQTGRLYPRKVDAASVFFYPEFWNGIKDSTSLRTREKELVTACKLHAAINKSASSRPIVPLVDRDLDALLGSIHFGVNKAESLAHKFMLYLDLYEESNNRDYLEAGIALLKSADPDLDYGPKTGSQGILAFMDFDERLSKDHCRKVISELQNARPSRPPYHENIVCVVHEILRDKSDDNARLGDDLQLAGLGFFLDYCNVQINPGLHRDLVKEVVSAALTATKLHLCNMGPAWPAADDGQNLSKVDTHALISCITDMVRAHRDKHLELAEKLDSLHGGVLEFSSLSDVMKKLGESVDNATSRYLWEQVASMQMSIFCTSVQLKSIAPLDDFICILEKVLRRKEIGVVETDDA